MKRSYLIATFFLVSFSFILTGCNLFGWTSGSDSESLIDDGNRLMRDGKFSEAVTKFAEAMAEDPNDSEARYYHAKATMRASGFNALTLGTEMTETDFLVGADLPFSGDDWSQEKTSRLYNAITVVYEDLRPIYYDSTTGKISKSEVDIDYALAAGIRGILIFQDSNLDGIIGDDDFDISIKYGGGQFEIQNLFILLAGLPAPAGKHRPQFSTSIISSEDSAYACSRIPEFNDYLDNIAVAIQESIDIITTILTEELGIDPVDVKSVLDQVIAVAHMYKINDGIDNDGNNGVDEETIDGIDNDDDGRIDEDSQFDCSNF